MLSCGFVLFLRNSQGLNQPSSACTLETTQLCGGCLDSAQALNVGDMDTRGLVLHHLGTL